MSNKMNIQESYANEFPGISRDNIYNTTINSEYSLCGEFVRNNENGDKIIMGKYMDSSDSDQSGNKDISLKKDKLINLEAYKCNYKIKILPGRC